jgi:organic radical activating enzyme
MLTIMNQILFKINQFKEFRFENLNIDGDLISPTVSLCHTCFSHIPAFVYHKNNQVWMIKSCKIHGSSHHMIERDYTFYKQLKKNHKFRWNDTVMFELSDRCNLECPHCYHMPDNAVADKSVKDVIEQIKTWYTPGMNILFAGAEASLHPKLIDVIKEIKNEFNYDQTGILTNGIRFSNFRYLEKCQDAGLKGMMIGLNHPSYINNETIRNKQIKAIENANRLNLPIGYIGYTMSSISELEDILNETINSNWETGMFRIRYGSDIGRYPDQERMYVSDIYKAVVQWCEKNNRTIKFLENSDDNIYHLMVNIDGRNYRLIQWCDLTDIDMEELRTGPWCAFVDDGVTNFLHQVIRRDIQKNRKLVLPDSPPLRYRYEGKDISDPLNFNNLI